MSVHFSSPTWKLNFPDPTTKLVALSLADQANDEGECWPSCASIGRRCGISKETVRTHMRLLESTRFLSRCERFVEGRQTSNKIILTPENFQPTCDRGVVAGEEGGIRAQPGGCLPAQGVLRRNVIETKENQSDPAAPVPHARPMPRPTLPEGKRDHLRNGAGPDQPKNVLEEFGEFWKVWPKRESKTLSLKAFTKYRKEGVTAERIMRALQTSIKRWATEKTERQFIPFPTTWLNRQLWNDEPEEVETLPWEEERVFATPHPDALNWKPCAKQQAMIDLANASASPSGDDADDSAALAVAEAFLKNRK